MRSLRQFRNSASGIAAAMAVAARQERLLSPRRPRTPSVYGRFAAWTHVDRRRAFHTLAPSSDRRGALHRSYISKKRNVGNRTEEGGPMRLHPTDFDFSHAAVWSGGIPRIVGRFGREARHRLYRTSDRPVPDRSPRRECSPTTLDTPNSAGHLPRSRPSRVGVHALMSGGTWARIRLAGTALSQATNRPGAQTRRRGKRQIWSTSHSTLLTQPGIQTRVVSHRPIRGMRGGRPHCARSALPRRSHEYRAPAGWPDMSVSPG